jgi:hypothetical protein
LVWFGEVIQIAGAVVFSPKNIGYILEKINWRDKVDKRKKD